MYTVHTCKRAILLRQPTFTISSIPLSGEFRDASHSSGAAGSTNSSNIVELSDQVDTTRSRPPPLECLDNPCKLRRRRAGVPAGHNSGDYSDAIECVSKPLTDPCSVRARFPVLMLLTTTARTSVSSSGASSRPTARGPNKGFLMFFVAVPYTDPMPM